MSKTNVTWLLKWGAKLYRRQGPSRGWPRNASSRADHCLTHVFESLPGCILWTIRGRLRFDISESDSESDVYKNSYNNEQPLTLCFLVLSMNSVLLFLFPIHNVLFTYRGWHYYNLFIVLIIPFFYIISILFRLLIYFCLFLFDIFDYRAVFIYL